MYMVNNDYDKFRSFSRLYDFNLYFGIELAHICMVELTDAGRVSNGQVAALSDWPYYQ